MFNARPRTTCSTRRREARRKAFICSRPTGGGWRTGIVLTARKRKRRLEPGLALLVLTGRGWSVASPAGVCVMRSRSQTRRRKHKQARTSHTSPPPPCTMPCTIAWHSPAGNAQRLSSRQTWHGTSFLCPIGSDTPSAHHTPNAHHTPSARSSGGCAHGGWNGHLE